MLGERIKALRIKNNMTQKNLADKLFVTAQAVSRWEKDEVEPSLSTVASLAKIFGVSVDEIIGIEKSDDADSFAELGEDNSGAEKESVKYPIARCTHCYGDIYDKNDIVRVKQGDNAGIKCRKCAQELTNQLVKNYDAIILESRRDYMRSARIKSIVAIILLAIIPTLGVIAASSSGKWLNVLDWVLCYLVLFYPISAALGTLFLRNTFVGRMANTIFNFWSRIIDKENKFTGAKKAFCVSFPNKILKIVSFPIAVITYVVVSPFVFPYAIYKSFKNEYEYYREDEFWKSDFRYKEAELKYLLANPEKALNYSQLYIPVEEIMKI